MVAEGSQAIVEVVVGSLMVGSCPADYSPEDRELHWVAHRVYPPQRVVRYWAYWHLVVDFADRDRVADSMSHSLISIKTRFTYSGIRKSGNSVYNK